MARVRAFVVVSAAALVLAVGCGPGTSGSPDQTLVGGWSVSDVEGQTGPTGEGRIAFSPDGTLVGSGGGGENCWFRGTYRASEDSVTVKLDPVLLTVWDRWFEGILDKPVSWSRDGDTLTLRQSKTVVTLTKDASVPTAWPRTTTTPQQTTPGG